MRKTTLFAVTVFVASSLSFAVAAEDREGSLNVSAGKLSRSNFENAASAAALSALDAGRANDTNFATPGGGPAGTALGTAAGALRMNVKDLENTLASGALSGTETPTPPIKP
jgi:hypothetical protein